MICETSIIIPAYNAERYIRDTIKSVIEQTYIDWELIIIDDGSVDGTADIVENFLADNRISYFYHKNSGVSASRNKGVAMSKGRYIAFLDADDVWEKNNLFEKVSCLKNNNQIHWVFSDMKTIDMNSSLLDSCISGTDDNIVEHYLLWDRTVVPGPCSNIVIKRECFNGGLSFDPAFSTAADQDFCINLSSQFVGKHIPEPLFSYRLLSNSMSRNIAIMEKDHIGVYKKASLNKLFKSKLFERKCFSNLYLILAGSWWVNAKNKRKGIYFVTKSLISYPPQIFRILSKFKTIFYIF